MEELVRRKPTRLYRHDYSTPGAYFITICTKNRKNILGSIVGGGAFDAPQLCPSEAGIVAEHHILSGNQIPGIHVDKYVIMPTHIHMIVRFIGGPDATEPRPGLPAVIGTFNFILSPV
mgnify:CR=1 FL=1